MKSLLQTAPSTRPCWIRYKANHLGVDPNWKHKGKSSNGAHLRAASHHRVRGAVCFLRLMLTARLPPPAPFSVKAGPALRNFSEAGHWLPALALAWA
jgi:hypothetical protein